MLVTEDGRLVLDNDRGEEWFEPVGTVIRRLRHAHGMSQRTLARALVAVSGNDALDREQVARWESGRRIPSRYWRHWLAGVLDASEEELERAAAIARLARSLSRISRRW